MAKKYDEEFKLKIVGLYNNGQSMNDIISKYGMSRSTLNNWIKNQTTI